MKLSEFLVKSRSKVTDIRNLKQLNVWGCHLTDVSLMSQMPFIEILVLANNCISSLKSLQDCHNLRELYLGINQIISFEELNYLTAAKSLTKLSLKDNPCCLAAGNSYRTIVLRMLPQLQELDGIEFTNQERHIVFLERKVHENSLNNLDYQEWEKDVAHSSNAPSARATPGVTPTRSSKSGDPRANESLLSLRSNTGSMIINLTVQHNQDNGLAQNSGNSDGKSSECIVCACREQEPNDAISGFYADHAFRRDIAEEQRRDRNARLLSGAISLVKEMDLASLEVLHRAVRDQLLKLDS